MAGVQTAKEALIQEIMGEALSISDKQSALMKEMVALRTTTLELVQKTQQSGVERLQMTGELARKDLAKERDAVVAQLKQMSSELVHAALVVNRSSRSFKSLALVVALVAGALGGMLASGLVFLTMFPQLLQ